MHKALTALTAGAILLGTAAFTDPVSGDQPGNPAVYQRIAAETDCTRLQTELDTASASHDRADPGSDTAIAATGYMRAADARMRALGCH